MSKDPKIPSLITPPTGTVPEEGSKQDATATLVASRSGRTIQPPQPALHQIEQFHRETLKEVIAESILLPTDDPAQIYLYNRKLKETEAAFTESSRALVNLLLHEGALHEAQRVRLRRYELIRTDVHETTSFLNACLARISLPEISDIANLSHLSTPIPILEGCSTQIPILEGCSTQIPIQEGCSTPIAIPEGCSTPISILEGCSTPAPL